MAEVIYLHTGPMRLRRAQAQARENARLEAAIQRADAEIAALEAELQRWQAVHQALYALHAPQEEDARG